jgi:hypothetical protein
LNAKRHRMNKSNRLVILVLVDLPAREARPSRQGQRFPTLAIAKGGGSLTCLPVNAGRRRIKPKSLLGDLTVIDPTSLRDSDKNKNHTQQTYEQ